MFAVKFPYELWLPFLSQMSITIIHFLNNTNFHWKEVEEDVGAEALAEEAMVLELPQPNVADLVSKVGYNFILISLKR